MNAPFTIGSIVFGDEPGIGGGRPASAAEQHVIAQALLSLPIIPLRPFTDEEVKVVDAYNRYEDARITALLRTQGIFPPEDMLAPAGWDTLENVR